MILFARTAKAARFGTSGDRIKLGETTLHFLIG
jgi:hypothetical protein